MPREGNLTFLCYRTRVHRFFSSAADQSDSGHDFISTISTSTPYPQTKPARKDLRKAARKAVAAQVRAKQGTRSRHRPTRVTHLTHFVNGYNGDISATAQVRMGTFDHFSLKNAAYRQPFNAQSRTDHARDHYRLTCGRVGTNPLRGQPFTSPHGSCKFIKRSGATLLRENLPIARAQLDRIEIVTSGAQSWLTAPVVRCGLDLPGVCAEIL
jgi:hypothetical protein